MRSPKPMIFRSMLWIAGFLATFGAWAIFAQLQGAVVSTGELVYTTGRIIELPHPDGGTIQTLNVKAGDSVKAGDIIATLDPTLIDIEEKILIDRLFTNKVRELRLQALLDGTPFPAIPDDLQKMAENNPDLAEMVARERQALHTQQAEWTALANQYEQERKTLERTAQSQGPVIEGLKEQEAILDRDYTAQNSLLERGIARRAEVSELERDLISLRNTLLQAQAEQDNTQNRLSTIGFAQERDMAERRSAIVQQLTELSQTRPEIEEQLASLTERRTRLDVKAPVDGIVDELRVAAEDVVILPGTLLATLIPTSDEPSLIAPIQPTQIDQVRVGQTALLRPMTRDFNNAEIHATVTRISDSLRTDPQTGMSYYEVTLDTNLDTLEKQGFIVVSGTPFEVAIQTSARSPLAYFMEPVQRSFRQALRE